MRSSRGRGAEGIRCSRFRGIPIVVARDVGRMSRMGEGMAVSAAAVVDTMAGMMVFEKTAEKKRMETDFINHY